MSEQRLIDANKLDQFLENAEIEAHHKRKYVLEGAINTLRGNIRTFPTIEPERKMGKWERHNTLHGDDVSGFVDPDWKCSECGRQANVNAWCMYDLTDFCPNCGARMVQEGEEDG